MRSESVVIQEGENILYNGVVEEINVKQRDSF